MSAVTPFPGLADDVAHLVRSSFSRPHFIESYPTAFAYPERWIELRDEGLLLGFCALRSFYWDHPGLGLVHGVCVGSVCTHPDHRGRGVGRRLMERARAEAEALAADFVFLFSDLDHFYKKTGFSPVGQEHLAPLQLSARLGSPSRDNAEAILKFHKNNRSSIRISIRKFKARDLTSDDSLAGCFWRFLVRNRQRDESMLGYAEFRELLSIPDMTIHALCDDRIQSLCFLGKGADFQDVLHGSAWRAPEHLVTLLATLLERERRRPFLLLLPPTELPIDLAAAATPLVYWCPLPSCRHDSAAIGRALEKRQLYPNSLQSI